MPGKRIRQWLLLLVAAAILPVLFLSPFKKDFFFPHESYEFIDRSVDGWIPDTTMHFGLDDGEWQAANRFVRDSILRGNTYPNDSTLASAVCHYIGESLGANTGADPAYGHNMNAWKQWQWLDGKKIQAYCVGYATVYQLFAGIAGLNTRMVAVSGNGINHIFCETYLREENSWALTDIMFDNVLIKDEMGSYFNSIRFKDDSNTCLLKNGLCNELVNASHFKYYTHNLYQWGYPFGKIAMVARILSPGAETVVSAVQGSKANYLLTHTWLYGVMAAFFFLFIKLVFKSR